ncbi:Predicted RNA-binding protein, contains PUA-like domain [Reichenbachiella agariperforans]|uniref:Predicted RNA-binding protein, contains PUA-like domain n=1 Tax=Reichenbachiella agariperforans TaxID=156994 RepID=A0A1M6JVA2_REIAG|nr:EVE domain-containing protein [Reichenbachiella agariperforans]SHJ50570.1 Predicted RNA-binding protein, contains PUA-like domain [Reichenbachiella agariperforans]
MNYWLVKTEPNTYSWDDFVNLGKDHWDGVRNYAARKQMMAMKVDDQVLFYHSVNEKSVVGIAQVVKEFYSDPTTDDDRWVVVDLVPVKPLVHPVSLDQIKNDQRLEEMVLIHNSRLSVQPVKKEEFDVILKLGDA